MMILFVSYGKLLTIKLFMVTISNRENCEEKMDAFLSRTYYLDGGYDNREGMIKLNALMEHVEVWLNFITLF